MVALTILLIVLIYGMGFFHGAYWNYHAIKDDVMKDPDNACQEIINTFMGKDKNK